MALSEWDEQLDAPVVVDQYGKVKLDKLPDGEYQLELASLAVKDDKDLVSVLWTILTPGPLMGAKVERPYFLVKDEKGEDGKRTGKRIRSDRDKGDLDRDLQKLGFDVDSWSKANGGAGWLASLKMATNVAKGIGVLAEKKTSDSGFHNLYLRKRSADDGKPEKFTNEHLSSASRDPFDGDNRDADDGKIPD